MEQGVEDSLCFWDFHFCSGQRGGFCNFCGEWVLRKSLQGTEKAA